jgi:hypothetical protein
VFQMRESSCRRKKHGTASMDGIRQGRQGDNGLSAGLYLRGLAASLSFRNALAIAAVFGAWLLGDVAACNAQAARTILYYEDECCRNITEGEFAVLYVGGLKLREPAQGWTVQSAAAALTSLGHQPQGGWVLSRFLSEAVMARLLQSSPFYRKPFTDADFQKSDLLLTISRARSVFPADAGLTQGEFAVLLAEALRLPGPRGGWSVSSAMSALSSQATPIKPAAGWNQAALLRESEMLQILASTHFHPTSLDPNMTVSSLRAYSLLFGKFEIATEGHFGLFVVHSLGVPAPHGGWSQEEALNYLQNRFGLVNGYGWNASAPLCTDTFERSLRQIINQLQRAPTNKNLPSRADKADLSANPGRPAAHSEIHTAAQNPGKNEPRKGTAAEDFLNSVRRNGLIPTDRCQIIPAQGLALLSQGEPFCVNCQPCCEPSSPEQPRPF